MKKWLWMAVAVGACGGAGSTADVASTNRDAGATVDTTDAGFVDPATHVDATPPGDATDMPDGAAPIGSDSAPPVDGSLAGPLTIEALQVAGTHNSYHIAPAVAFDASHKYTQLPLDQQLAGGVRAFELDLHLRDDGGFDIYHITLIDPNSTCATLQDCLGVVSTWSGAHPKHTPIFIWFELKDDTGGQPINDLVPIETAILKVFPKEQLITSAWLRGAYASPHERILKSGWPTLEEAQGKIMFSIITRDARTQQYAHDFTSLDDRLMFVNPTPAQYDMPWASITKVDDLLDSASIAGAHKAHLLVDANICAVNMKDDECQMRLTTGISAGVNMLHDDLPFPIAGRAYSLKLPGGSPGCNPVTAPPGCKPSLLE